MVGIERSETAQKSTLEIQDKMQSETKFNPRIFFSDGQKFFFQTEFCLRLYLSQTEFCLGLNLSQTRLCLGLNFVSDYIPQLYLVSNLLIFPCGFLQTRLGNKMYHFSPISLFCESGILNLLKIILF